MKPLSMSGVPAPSEGEEAARRGIATDELVVADVAQGLAARGVEGLEADVSIQGGAGDDVIECVAGDSYELVFAAEQSTSITNAVPPRQIIVTGDAGRDTIYVESGNGKVHLRGGTEDDSTACAPLCYSGGRGMAPVNGGG